MAYTEKELGLINAGLKAVAGRDYLQDNDTLYRGQIDGSLLFITDNFTLKAQVAVGSIVADSASSNLTYDPKIPAITPSLPDSGVTAGVYGNASNVPQLTLNEYGIVTLAANVPVVANFITSVVDTSTIDLTVTAGALSADVINGSITYTKIQNVTTNKLLGRATAGVGSAEEITLGTNLSFSGTTLDVTGVPTVTPAALTKTDDTNVTLTLGGTPLTSLLQAVSLTLGWTGTLADARITSATTWNNKVTSLSAGTGISIGGTTTVPIVTNSLPDQTVVLTNGTGISVTGTYPNFTITNTSPSSGGTVTSVAISTPTGLSISGSPITTSGTLAISLTAGYVIPTTTEETNWNTAYTNRITSLTTTGTSGAATLVANVLNIPQYTDAFTGTVTSVSVVSANGFTGSVATSTTTPAITLTLQNATTSQSGQLTSTDWNTFNNKGSGTVTSISTAGLISGGTITSSGAITTSISTNKLVGRSTAGTGVMEEITLGTGLSFSGTTLNVSGFGTGTVTSVSVVTNQGVSGSVATSTTTPAITLTLGALTGVTSFNGLIITANTGVVTTGTWSAATILANKGGTGFSSYTIGDILYADTTSTLAKLSDVAAGSYLRSGGVGVAPSWSSLILANTSTANYIRYSTATNTVGENANLQFDGTTVFIGSTPQLQLGVLAGSTTNPAIYLKVASQLSTNYALSSTSTGTITNLNSSTTLNLRLADVTKLSFNSTQTTFSDNDILMNSVAISGVASGLSIKVSNTSITSANLGVSGGRITAKTGTITDSSGAGTRAVMNSDSFAAPVFASTNAVTVIQPATVYIAGAPTVGANMTFTNTALSLWVAAGESRFDGRTTFGSGVVYPYVAKTANYTITTADYTVDCTSNTFTITLPTAVGITGQVFNVANSGTGVITINTTSSQTINGSASGAITLAQYNNLKVQSNGANWIKL